MKIISVSVESSDGTQVPWVSPNSGKPALQVWLRLKDVSPQQVGAIVSYFHEQRDVLVMTFSTGIEKDTEKRTE